MNRRTGMLVVLVSMIILGGCSPTYDAKPLPIVYCEHMDYNIEINSDNRPICVFDDNSSCLTDDFYNGECGQDKVKAFRLREEWEDVYLEFEECEKDLVPSEPRYLLEQPHCECECGWN